MVVCRAGSTARDYFDDFQPVARRNHAAEEFRRRDCLTIVLYDDAAGRQLLRHEKFLNRARQLCRNLFSIGSNRRHGYHVVNAASQSFHTGS